MSGNVPGAWYSSCVPRSFSATEVTPDNRPARSRGSWPPRLGAGHDLGVRLDGALPEGRRGRAGAGAPETPPRSAAASAPLAGAVRSVGLRGSDDRGGTEAAPGRRACRDRPHPGRAFLGGRELRALLVARVAPRPAVRADVGLQDALILSGHEQGS